MGLDCLFLITGEKYQAFSDAIKKSISFANIWNNDSELNN